MALSPVSGRTWTGGLGLDGFLADYLGGGLRRCENEP
jgi:hypothetical protein